MSNFREIFRDITNSPQEYAEDWKKTRKRKVIGYLCTNLPEELIYAAGILPVRILGSNEPESITGAHLFQAALCSFSRDCFAQCLKGNFDYLDGILYGLGCMHTRQVFQAWQNEKPDAFTYELQVPALLHSPDAKQYLIGEIQNLKSALEKWTGKDISNNDIDKSVDIYNTNRRLMLSVYELMKADTPPLTGVELLQMTLSGMLIDKQDHNKYLEDTIAKLSLMKGTGKCGPRIMLLGSVNNDFGLIEMIENCGARIVIDDYCTGNRYYQAQVVHSEDRLAALAGRMVEKPPCPLKDLSTDRRRVTHISRLIDAYRVEGVIYTIQRQCDSHGLDYPSVQAIVDSKGMPMLKIELDFSSAIAQYRTRLEAFIEMLRVS